MWPFVSGFSHLAYCFQGSFTLQHVSVLHSFLWLDNTPLYGYTAFCLFIHQLMDTGLFPLFAPMNNAAMNIHVKGFVQTYVFNSLGQILRSRIAGSYNKSMLNFLRTYQTAAAPFYISASNVRGFQFLYILINTCYYLSFWLQSFQWM